MSFFYINAFFFSHYYTYEQEVALSNKAPVVRRRLLPQPPPIPLFPPLFPEGLLLLGDGFGADGEGGLVALQLA